MEVTQRPKWFQRAGRLRQMARGLPFGRFFVRLVVFFSLFFVTIQAVNWQTYRFLENASVKVLQNSYSHIATAATLSLDNIIKEVYHSNTLVGMSPATLNAFSSQWSLDTLADYAEVPGVIRALSQVAATSEYIDTVAIVKRDSDIVISDTALYSIDEYFGQYHSYQEHPADFWRQHVPATPFEVLQPMTLFTSSGEKRVLPVVQSKVNGIPSRNLYVVDLNLDKIEQMLNHFRSTDNSVLLVTNQQMDQFLFSSAPEEDFDAERFLDTLRQTDAPKGQLRLDAQEYFFFTYDTDMFFTPVKVVVSLPQADLRAIVRSEFAYRSLLNFGILLLAIPLITYFSYKSYKPIRQLMDTLSMGKKRPAGLNNEISLIESQMAHLSQTLAQAQNKAAHSEHLAAAQLLHRYFQGYTMTTDEEAHLEKLLPNSPPGGYHFLLLKPVYRDALRQTYPPEFTDKIFQTLKNLVTSYFCDNMDEADLHVFEISSNRLCVLAEGAAAGRGLMEQANTLLTLFRTDEEQLSLFIVNGTPSATAAGLKDAFQQAQNTLSSLSPYNSSCILNATEAMPAPVYELPLQEEEKLANLIAAGKREELLLALENGVLGLEHLSQLSTPAMQRLFMQLYFAAIKVLREQGKSCSPNTFERFSSFIARVDEKTPKESQQFLLAFFDDVCGQTERVPLTLSAELFKSYIDAHFTQDLTVEALAQRYNTSPQYMARLLKRELGMAFQVYLHQLRVREAKRLLAGTRLSINEIVEKTGYHSRNTFIRSFKSIEGITPREYRHLQGQKNGKPEADC